MARASERSLQSKRPRGHASYPVLAALGGERVFFDWQRDEQILATILNLDYASVAVRAER